MVIQGGPLSGGRVDSHGDHRIAMSFAVASLAATGPIDIDETDAVTIISATTNSGNIDVDAGGTMTARFVIAGGPGDVTLRTTAGDIEVDTIDAAADAVTLNAAGSITDINGDTTNITAADLIADAGTGINLDTDVDRIDAAVSGTGDIDIDESSAVQLVDVSTNDGDIYIDADGTMLATLVTAGGASDMTLRTTVGNINVGLLTAAGDDVILNAAASITDVNGAAVNVVAANLVAVASTGINLDTSVDQIEAETTGTGAIDIDETDAVSLSNVRANNGAITIDAGGTMTAFDVESTNAGGLEANDIRLSTTGTASDIEVRRIQANGPADVFLVAGDDIVDTGRGDGQRIVANDLLLDAGNGTDDGGGIHLETTVDRIDARVQSAAHEGPIDIVETDAVTLGEFDAQNGTGGVFTANGPITVVAGGTITALLVDSSNTDDSTNDITLTALGAASDIVVGQVLASQATNPQNDAILTAGDDILNTSTAPAASLVADDAILTAANGTADGDRAIDLRTQVQDLAANVTGGGRGDIRIVEVDDLNLATADTLADARTVSTVNGRIDIETGGSLTVVDGDGSNDDAARTSDVEVVARGPVGGLHFEIGGDLVLGPHAQIDVFNATLTAPPPAPDTVLQGSTVVTNAAVITGTVQGDVRWGEFAQMRTLAHGSGEVIGLARQIAGRPLQGGSPPAFYDPASIIAPTLTRIGSSFQARLQVTIGRPGETGLSITIDWGTFESDRFETITGLVGGQTYTFVHDYAEREVLLSRIRRGSAADDISVQFGVSMEGSMLIFGRTVTTADGSITVEPDVAAKGTPDGLHVVTSTDLIGTVIPADANANGTFVENGLAKFTVPSLEFGLPIFIKEVELPVFEPQVVAAQAENIVTPPIVTTERAVTAIIQVLGREEFLELQVNSPDPDAAPLAVKRLPDEFLSGKEGASFIDL